MEFLNKFKRSGRNAFAGFSDEKWDAVPLTAAVIAAVLALNVLLYAAVNLFSLVIPPKEKDRLVLSGATDALFADAIREKREVTVMFCMAEEDLKVHDTGKYVYQTAKNLAERYPDFVKLSFVNIFTKRNEKGEKVELEKFAFIENADGEKLPATVLPTSVLFLYNKDRFVAGETVSRLVTDTTSASGFSDFYTLDSSGQAIAYNGEEILSAMILRVMDEERKTAYFTVHHGETADYSFRSALVCAGYNVWDLDLRNNNVPDDADLVVISSPRNDFEMSSDGSGIRTEIARLTDYAENGGNVYVSVDPYVKNGLPHLMSFLEKYGISVDRTESDDGRSVINILRETDNAITSDGFTLVAEYAEGTEKADAVREAASGSGGVLLTQTATLTCSGNATPILRSSPGARPEANGKPVGENGVYTVAACSETAGGGVIFAIPTVYSTASDAMVASGYSNRDFLFAVCDKLFGADHPPYGTARVDLSGTILENLTMADARVITVILFALPAAVALSGVILIRRRKNR